LNALKKESSKDGLRLSLDDESSDLLALEFDGYITGASELNFAGRENERLNLALLADDDAEESGLGTEAITAASEGEIPNIDSTEEEDRDRDGCFCVDVEVELLRLAVGAERTSRC
jgi:hypothetical protein